MNVLATTTKVSVVPDKLIKEQIKKKRVYDIKKMSIK